MQIPDITKLLYYSISGAEPELKINNKFADSTNNGRKIYIDTLQLVK